MANTHIGLIILAAVLPAVAGAQSALDAPLDPIGCLIEPQDRIEVATPVEGIVAEVAIERGDRVEAGQVIVRLDSEVEQIALALAQARAANDHGIRARAARVAFLEAQSERNATLAARNAISATVAEESRLEVEIAREELEEARLELEFARIEAQQAAAVLDLKTLRAPVSGIVTERLLSPGEYQQNQSHIVTIARMDVLRVEAFAPLSYFPRLSVGDPVLVRPEAPIGGSYEGRIEVIDRVFDPATATFGLRIAVPNPDLALPAGLRCDVAFTAG